MNIDKLKFYKFLNILLCLILVFSVFSLWPKQETVVKNERLEKNTYENYSEYLFLGDSLTNNYTLQKYFPEYPIINSGVGGDKTENILNTLNNRVFKYRPKKVIILVRINDLTHFEDPNYVASNIKEIAKRIKEKLPNCEIYIESIYPVNYSWKNRFNDTVPSMDDMIYNIKATNNKLKEICKKYKYEYLDAFSILEKDNMLAKEYSKDGIHLNEEGYKIITNFLKERVFNIKNDFKRAQI